jgi:hypothetical protein
MESSEGRWSGGPEVVVVMVGHRVRKRELREGIWAKTQNRAVVAWFRAYHMEQ